MLNKFSRSSAPILPRPCWAVCGSTYDGTVFPQKILSEQRCLNANYPKLFNKVIRIPALWGVAFSCRRMMLCDESRSFSFNCSDGKYRRKWVSILYQYFSKSMDSIDTQISFRKFPSPTSHLQVSHIFQLSDSNFFRFLRHLPHFYPFSWLFPF